MKDGSWACHLTLEMIHYGIWDVPFYLAIGDKLYGTFCIAHLIGDLYVVCSCSILVCRYLDVSHFMGFRVLCQGTI